MPRAYFEGECPYDPARTDLLDDVDAIVELLALQHRMQMREKDVEMLLTVAVGHDDGDAVPGRAVSRSADTARQQGGVLSDYVRLSVVVLMFHHNKYPTSCTSQLQRIEQSVFRTPSRFVNPLRVHRQL